MITGEIAQHAGDEAARLLRVLVDDLDDGGYVHRVVAGVPAVEIRHHGDGGVGDLGFAGQLGLGHGGHADHIETLRFIAEGLGLGGELRPLHADIGAALHAGDVFRPRRRMDARDEVGRDRMGHGHMGHAAIAEEAGGAAIGAVHILIDEHEGPRRQLRLEGATGGDGDEIGDARPLQGVDIGAVVDARGRESVAATVAGQEDGLRLANTAEAQGVGGLAPGGCDPFLAGDGEARQVVDA